MEGHPLSFLDHEEQLGPLWEVSLRVGPRRFTIWRGSLALYGPSILSSRVMAVDLGLGKKAVCSVLLGRKGVVVG